MSEKMTYQERVYNFQTALFESYRGTQLFYRREFKECAILTVAAQANAIRDALQPLVSDEYINSYLLDYGYVEPKTE